MRTCTGCRQTAPQRELVRLVFDGPQLIIDPGSLPGVPTAAQRGAAPGRGAYVHPRAACVTAAGLSRSFRRTVRPVDVARIVSQMSPTHDNLGDQPLQNAGQNAPGLADGDTVEMPPRIKAKKKDDRSEDARL